MLTLLLAAHAATPCDAGGRDACERELLDTLGRLAAAVRDGHTPDLGAHLELPAARAAHAGSSFAHVAISNDELALRYLHGLPNHSRHVPSDFVTRDDLRPVRIERFPRALARAFPVGGSWVGWDQDGGIWTSEGQIANVPDIRMIAGGSEGIVVGSGQGWTWVDAVGVDTTSSKDVGAHFRWIDAERCAWDWKESCTELPSKTIRTELWPPPRPHGTTWYKKRSYSTGWRLAEGTSIVERVHLDGRRDVWEKHRLSGLPHSVGPGGEVYGGYSGQLFTWFAKGDPQLLPVELQVHEGTAVWNERGELALLLGHLIVVMAGPDELLHALTLRIDGPPPRLEGWLGTSHLLLNTGTIEVEPGSLGELPPWFAAHLGEASPPIVSARPPGPPAVALASLSDLVPVAPEPPKSAQAYAGGWSVGKRSVVFDADSLSVDGRVLTRRVVGRTTPTYFIILADDWLYQRSLNTFLRRSRR